jgi:hypothetical protein
MVTENLKKFNTHFHCNCWTRENEISLTINVIDPKIGGVMIMVIEEQEMTTIRAIADLLQRLR